MILKIEMQITLVLNGLTLVFCHRILIQFFFFSEVVFYWPFIWWLISNWPNPRIPALLLMKQKPQTKNICYEICRWEVGFVKCGKHVCVFCRWTQKRVCGMRLSVLTDPTKRPSLKHKKNTKHENKRHLIFLLLFFTPKLKLFCNFAKKMDKNQ